MTDTNVIPLVAADALRGLRNTDLGNSERLVERHGERIAYCHANASWYIWDDKRWRVDDDGQIMRLANDVVKHPHAEISRMDNSDDRRTLSKWATASEALPRVKAMVEGARNLATVSPDELDAHPYLLNVPNGVARLC